MFVKNSLNLAEMQSKSNTSSLPCTFAKGHQFVPHSPIISHFAPPQPESERNPVYRTIYHCIVIKKRQYIDTHLNCVSLYL